MTMRGWSREWNSELHGQETHEPENRPVPFMKVNTENQAGAIQAEIEEVKY